MKEKFSSIVNIVTIVILLCSFLLIGYFSTYFIAKHTNLTDEEISSYTKIAENVWYGRKYTVPKDNKLTINVDKVKKKMADFSHFFI